MDDHNSRSDAAASAVPVTEAPTASKAANPRRKRALLGVTAIVVLAGLAWGVYDWLVLSHLESTDNAYVQGNVIQITPQIGGTVTAILADETDLLAAAATWAIYRERETPTRKVPIDTVGLSLLVIWVGALQLMLDMGKELDWFHSGKIIAFAVVAVAGLAFFLAWELTEEHPVVDLSLFKSRNFWSSALATAVGYGVFFGNVVILPLWLQQFMGYTATQAGMILAPVGLFAIVFSTIVGLTLNRVDPRKYASFSFLVFALVLWMRSRFTTQADFDTIMIPTLIQGVAMAFFFIPLVTITLAGLEPSRIPAASGLSNFMRITAGAVGTSISTTMWENRAALHHANLAESVHQGNQAAMSAMEALQGRGMSHDQALGYINNLATQQAYMLSSQDIFYGSAVLFLLLIPLIWLARRPKGAGSADAAAGAH